MKSMLLKSLFGLAAGLFMSVTALAVTRTVDIDMPSSPVYAGQSVSIPTSASTDGPGGEQIGFYQLEYSVDGGANWNAVAYDVDIGTSATRTVNLTAGAAGSTIIVRLRVAFRHGTAGDVDYAGNAIDWGGSWGTWAVPPARIASITVATTRTATIDSPGPIYAGQSVTIPTSASTDGPGGEQIGFYQLEYSTNGGSSWNSVAYDVNVGTSASRPVNLTAGAAGTTIMVRMRIAYRYGTAGDVDYAGNAIDWSGTWGTWAEPPARTATFTILPGAVNVTTASSAGTYHVKGSIVKDGNPGDAQDFGDGVLFEVFKRSGSTDTILWSSLLARPNPNNPAKVDLLVDLAAGDGVYYRLVSPTSDTDYDSVTFPVALSASPASVLTLNSITPSSGPTDNKTDDIQGLINSAMTAIASGSPAYDRVEIVLPAGTYYLQDSGAGSSEALLSMANTENITLRGAGAKLIINDVTPKMFLSLDNSANVEIGDLELDYTDACLPYIQGTVASVSGTTATVDLAWAPQGTSRFASGLFCVKFDPSNPDQVAGYFDISACSISGSTANLTVSSGTLAVGDPVVMAIRSDTARLQEAALRLGGCTDCTFRDVTLRAGGWIALIGRGNNGLHFVGYNIERASGSSRLITTNGDAIQLKDSLRGPTIDGCHFEHLLDDGVNLHATINPISSVTTHTFVAGGGTVRVGDVLQVFERNTDDLPYHYGQALYYQTHYVVTGVSGSTITVDGDIEPTANHYVNVSASGEGFLIRHCTFEKSRNRGCLIQTGYGYIYDNDFLENAGLALSFEANLGQTGSVEGPYPHHTLVTDNLFYLNGYDGTHPAIQIWGHNLSSPPAPMFEDLASAIIGNDFEGQTSSPVVVLTGAESFDAGSNTVNP